MPFPTEGKGLISGRSPGNGGVSKKKASSPDSGAPSAQYNLTGGRAPIKVNDKDQGDPKGNLTP